MSLDTLDTLDTLDKLDTLDTLDITGHANIDSACLLTVSSIFKTGSTLKCYSTLGLDFTALTHKSFSVALYMYILALYSTCWL